MEKNLKTFKIIHLIVLRKCDSQIYYSPQESLEELFKNHDCRLQIKNLKKSSYKKKNPLS